MQINGDCGHVTPDCYWLEGDNRLPARDLLLPVLDAFLFGLPTGAGFSLEDKCPLLGPTSRPQ